MTNLDTPDSILKAETDESEVIFTYSPDELESIQGMIGREEYIQYIGRQLCCVRHMPILEARHRRRARRAARQ